MDGTFEKAPSIHDVSSGSVREGHDQSEKPERGHLTPLSVLLFAGGILLCLSPIASPPLALAAGVLIALTLGAPFPRANQKAAKVLLQISVIGLGFGLDAAQVAEAGRRGFLFAAGTIAGTMLAGAGLGRWFRVDRNTTHLVSSGTAICGGSAIAAMAPAIDAKEEEVSVALGTVFILNAVGLFLFPPVGRGLSLSQTQFGIWSAIAIHDTSSVVGAAANYGAEALAVATTVKLTRALWIVPLVLAFSWISRKRRSFESFPWFILLFFAASIGRTMVPSIAHAGTALAHFAKIGFTLTLFLIGTGLTRDSIAAVGTRPLLLGVTLWVLVSIVTLWAVLSTIA